jgi:hypothetical protein
MSTNEASGTSRIYVVKITKLIWTHTKVIAKKP